MAIVKSVYLPAAFILVAVLVYRFYGQLLELFASHSTVDFVSMVALASTVHFFSALSYYYILKGTLSKPILDVGYVLNLQFSKLPARYLPGGVWHSAGKVSDLSDIGYKKQELAKVFLKEVVVNWGAALGAFIIFSVLKNDVIIALVVFSVLMISIYFVSFNFVNFHKAFFVFIPVWMIYGSAFYIYIQPIDEFVGISYIAVIGDYSLSALIGFLAVFAPQGVGVSEFSFLYLQGITADFEVVVTYLVAFRCIVLLGDIVAYLVFMLLKAIK